MVRGGPGPWGPPGSAPTHIRAGVSTSGVVILGEGGKYGIGIISQISENINIEIK